MKKVLIFSYYWPPASSVGVWRFLKMSNYLLDNDWQPIVITVKSGAYTAMDPKLEEEVDPRVRVYKTASPDPYRLYNILRGAKGKDLPEAMSNLAESKSAFHKFSIWVRSNLFIPDPKIGWAFKALKQAKQICKEEKIDAIISTGPPNSVHLAGMRLAKATQIPWMMDFRDPWTSNYLVAEIMGRSKWANAIDYKLETKALKRADKVVVVSDGMQAEYQDRAKDLMVIPNGFDNQDYNQDFTYQKQEKFTISYIGSLKPNQDIGALWEAFAELVKENEQLNDKLVIEFLGSTNEFILDKLRNLGCEKHISTPGRVSHKEAVQHMQKTDMLLFVIPHASYNKSIITGKLFEYIGAKTPIFSVGPSDGDASKVIERVGTFPMLDYQDKAGMKKHLLAAFNTWSTSENGLPRLAGEGTEKFTRQSLTKDLAQALNEMIS